MTLGFGAKALRQRAHQPGNGGGQVGRVDAVVAAVAKRHAPAAIVHRHQVGVLPCASQAGGTAVGVPSTLTRPAGANLVDGALEPVEVKLARGRLHGRPGEFAQARHGQPAACIKAMSAGQRLSGHCSG